MPCTSKTKNSRLRCCKLLSISCVILSTQLQLLLRMIVFRHSLPQFISNHILYIIGYDFAKLPVARRSSHSSTIAHVFSYRTSNPGAKQSLEHCLWHDPCLCPSCRNLSHFTSGWFYIVSFSPPAQKTLSIAKLFFFLFSRFFNGCQNHYGRS